MEDNYVRQGVGGNNNDLFPGLDPNTTAALIASEKNWNTDFKGAGVGGMAQNVAATVDFTANIPIFTTYVLSYVTTIVTSYLAQATVDMLSIDASQIAANAGKMVPNFIKTPGEIMGELLKNSEDIMDEKNKELEKQEADSINNVISGQVSKITNKINEKLEGVQDTIADISKYAYMGPSWVKNQVDLATKKIIESSCKEIGKTRDNTKQNIQDQIDSLAESMAKKIADKTNIQTQEQSKEQIDQMNKKKAEAMTKAKTAITNAKLKLMALIGG